MQQDKFDRAALIMETEEDPPACSSTPNSSFTILSPDKRKNSAEYWKKKFEASQEIVKQLSETSIQLEQIPGLLTIQRVKPKLSKKSTRVTQVHGSMTGKDVLSMVKTIKEKKENDEKEKEAKKQHKQTLKEAFFHCKESCNCSSKTCDAAHLKECPNCHDIMKSVCSKNACKVDGCKPIMITPAAASKQVKRKKPEEYKSDVDSQPSIDHPSDQDAR